MQNANYRKALARELLQHIEKHELVGNVQVRGRLVEEQQLRLLGEGLREHNHLSLATRQFREIPLFERRYLKVVEQVVHALPCLSYTHLRARETRHDLV